MLQRPSAGALLVAGRTAALAAALTEVARRTAALVEAAGGRVAAAAAAGGDCVVAAGPAVTAETVARPAAVVHRELAAGTEDAVAAVAEEPPCANAPCTMLQTAKHD